MLALRVGFGARGIMNFVPVTLTPKMCSAPTPREPSEPAASPGPGSAPAQSLYRGPFGVAVPTSALCAAASVIPARLRTVLGRLPHSRENKRIVGRSSRLVTRWVTAHDLVLVYNPKLATFRRRGFPYPTSMSVEAPHHFGNG